MKKLFFIYHALPSKFQGGSELAAYNLIKIFSKKYKVTLICFSIGKNPRQSLIDLKKLGIEVLIKKDHLKYNQNISFIPKYFLDEDKISKNQIFLKNKININKKDKLIAMGSISIASAEHILCNKIAIVEDPQPFVKIERERLSINFNNFHKKILKLIYLKVFYINFWNWFKKITKTYNEIHCWSKNEAISIQKKIKRKVNFIRCPIEVAKIYKPKNKKFTIAMISYSITQDFDGIRKMNKYLITVLKKKDLLDKVNIYLIMNIFYKNLPKDIKEIINQKFIHIKNFDQKGLIEKIDLLYYPSNYKVGVRSKILFSMSKKIIVATNKASKYGIPELKNNFNCLMGIDNFDLVNKIVKIIYKKNKSITSNAYNLIKKAYSPKKIAKNLIN